LSILTTQGLLRKYPLGGPMLITFRLSFFVAVFCCAASAIAQEPALSPNVPRENTFKKYGETPGFLQFRGNPSHTYYGKGPVPQNPKILWRYPDAPMVGYSSVGGKKKKWTGLGWTGQPVIWPGMDGQGWELIFGAYDHRLHFVDWRTGQERSSPFQTGDLIKGTPTVDPDGFPLVYFGSRDNKFRIVAMDQEPREELWALDGNRPGKMWNNDWDGNASIVNGHLIVGGENSLFYVIQLNRSYDKRGHVQVRPEILLEMPGYNKKLLEAVGDRNVSIESSVAVFEDRAYFANSGGRIVGVDLSGVHDYQDYRDLIVFDYWVGDDTDASIVIDEEGFLYVAVEKERMHPRSRKRQEELGQLVKLDPYAQERGEDPVVWDEPPIQLEGSVNGGFYDAGIWATPALAGGYLYVPTHNGPLFVVDKDSGEVVWQTQLGHHSWSSPIVVDDQLIVANCSGQIFNYDVSNPRRPIRKWEFQIPSGSCIEATPVIWEGRILVGSRDGYVYALGEKL